MKTFKKEIKVLLVRAEIAMKKGDIKTASKSIDDIVTLYQGKESMSISDMSRLASLIDDVLELQFQLA